MPIKYCFDYISDILLQNYNLICQLTTFTEDHDESLFSGISISNFFPTKNNIAVDRSGLFFIGCSLVGKQ